MTKTLDIGCGTNPRNPYNASEVCGVDIVRSNIPGIMQADLTWEGIPCDDYEFQYVTAFDFLEHLPMRVYVAPQEELRDEYEGRIIRDAQTGYTRNVMIELFNEVYRVLDHGGIFLIQVPIYPSPACFQDPTHTSVWTPDTINYFSGDYFGFHDHYGHTSRFEKHSMRIGHPFSSHMYVELKAIKNLTKDSPYLLKY